jgi:hypothetical protein
VSAHSEMLDATAAIVTALTPKTDQDPEDGFLRVETGTIDDAEDHANSHRMFSVRFSHGRSIDPFTGQLSRMVVRRGVDIAIIYRIQDRTPREIEPVIGEDGDQILWALIDPTNKPTLTGAQFGQFRPEATENIELSASGKSLIVTHTVPIWYRLEKY